MNPDVELLVEIDWLSKGEVRAAILALKALRSEALTDNTSAGTRVHEMADSAIRRLERLAKESRQR